MATDHIRYDLLAQQALRGVVRTVLMDIAKKGIPGEHHFYITFDTGAEGVRLSQRLREKYPEEMTIVLQHQFWDLVVSEASFEVGLAFGGVAERLLVPFDAIKSFFDPSVQFGLQFEQASEDGASVPAPPQSGDASPPQGPAPQEHNAPAPTDSPAPAKPAAKVVPDEPDKPPGGGEVVRLDRFRKK
jgi:hypothetical protein